MDVFTSPEFRNLLKGLINEILKEYGLSNSRQEMITKKEAADFFKVDLCTIHTHTKGLPHVKIGRRKVINKQYLIEHFTKNLNN